LRLRILRDHYRVIIKVDYSGILHCGEGKDIEQVAQTSIIILYVCVGISFDLSKLSLLYLLYLLVYFLLIFDQSFHIISLYFFELSKHQEKKLCTSTLILRGITRSSEPFIRFTALFLDYLDWVLVVDCGCF